MRQLPWHQEAIALRQQGLTHAAIGVRVGRHPKRIALVLRANMPQGPKRMGAFSHWSAEKDAQLRELVVEGLMAPAIAARLGTTRNAVLGRAHRLGLTLNSKPRKTPSEPKPKKMRSKVNFRGATMDEKQKAALRYDDMEPRFQEGFEGQTGRLSVSELRAFVCRFPIQNEARETKYCGLPSHRETSWCEQHFHRVCAAPRYFREAAE